LLAAIQVLGHLALSGDAHFQEVATAQLVPGPGRDALIHLAQQALAAAPPGEPGYAPSQVAGYKFVSYTPTAAVLAIVYRAHTGALTVSDTTVMWDSGDWKIAVLPDGSLGPPAVTIPSIAGFTQFEGA
jgi:hypothetical protein